MTTNISATGRRAYGQLVKFTVAMGLLLFLPAWSLRYWQGWLYLVLFCGACFVSTAYFLKVAPDLVERRMSAGARAEQEPRQKLIMAIASICFLLQIVIPALDHRANWSAVPPWLVIAADCGLVLSFLLIVLVLRQNSYAAATIRVEAGQPVISTGAYAIVRHPMYAAALPMFLCTPVALGSYWGLIPAAAILPILVWRLLDEERFLNINLPGYPDYCRKVRYRLVPGVW